MNKATNKKVLLISPMPPPEGGIATWTVQYLSWLEKKNIDVEVVNTALIGKRKNAINSATSNFEEVKRTFLITKNLISKTLTFKPTVAHLNTPCGKYGIIRDFICVSMLIMLKVPTLVHYRCNVEDKIANRKLQLFFLGRIAKMAKKNIVLNKSSQDYLQNKFKISSSVIPNFIDKEFVISKPKKISDEIKEVTYVGHLQKDKGLFEIIEMAKELKQIKVHLAGPLADELINVQFPENIKLHGRINKNEIKSLLISSDVFIFPSYTEGFSNAILEAMSVGLPIITTPVGANKDALESKGAVFVDVGDSKGIVSAIYKLQNVDYRKEMSKWNVDKVLKNYTTDKVMEKIIGVYESILMF